MENATIQNSTFFISQNYFKIVSFQGILGGIGSYRIFSWPDGTMQY